MRSGLDQGRPWLLTTRPPAPREYARLCEAVGWHAYADEARAAVAIEHSLAFATAVVDDEAVGMGRVIGDRALFFYLQDVAVDPAHQRKGIGTAIVACLMTQIRAIAPPGSSVGLFAAAAAAGLYSGAGFVHSAEGMTQYLPWDDPIA